MGGGYAAGLVNTLAGGGSMISLPILLLLGLDASTANGTNRIAILLQNVVGSWRYSRKGAGRSRLALTLAIPACLGAALGARLAIKIDQEIFRLVLGCVFAAMIPVLLARPKRWLEGAEVATNPTSRTGPGTWLLFFGLGVYGGFLQAGIGIFILCALVLGTGHNLLNANAIKVLLIAIYTAVALAFFIGAGQVDWSIGLALACGNMAGAWTGVHLATTRGTLWLHRFLLVIVTTSAIWLISTSI